jgi:integrase
LTTVKKIKVRGKERWCLDFGTVNGERGRRLFFKTETEAWNAARKADKETKAAGSWWAMRPTEEKQAAVSVFREMVRDGVTPSEVWKVYKSIEAPPKESIHLKAAIYEMLIAKRAAGRDPRYLDELETYLLKFAKNREKLSIDRLTSGHLEHWFTERKEGQTTRASNLGRLSALFGFCVRRGYLIRNPCQDVEHVQIAGKAPKVLTVNQARGLMDLCAKKAKPMLAYMALGLFAGIRPEELKKLNWSKIDMRRGRVMIDHDVAKVRQWRIVQLEATAKAWLKLCEPKHGPIAPKVTTLRRMRRALRDKLQMEWPQDVLRHTAASYLLAKHKDAGKVALMLGNSPRVLLTNYRNLVTDWRKFWAVRP